ncbi:MAG: 3-ketoacyl-ACP reductase [Caldicoprobacterales bacterium]|jgi:3-oxoacyl-[acyl-carrier protein] reductase|nr:3-ketoacyl-ACP reductase [Clostridiales bacterium]
MSKGKVAIVTGGSRGIGYGIAQKLSEQGYRLAIFGTSDINRVKENIDKLKKYGQDVIYVQGSLSIAEDRDRLVDQVLDEFGRIDLLVNNAGVAPKVRMDILETTIESFDYVVDTNLKGTFFLTQRVANEMIKAVEKYEDYKPIIINISSMSAYTSSISRGEYCISKAGISMVTKLFADRLADYGINVYEIRPGIIATDMTSTVKDKYDALIEGGLTPIKRWGYPEDIAKAVWALCSGLLPYSTGEVINVDGGFHIRRL